MRRIYLLIWLTFGFASAASADMNVFMCFALGPAPANLWLSVDITANSYVATLGASHTLPNGMPVSPPEFERLASVRGNCDMSDVCRFDNRAGGFKPGTLSLEIRSVNSTYIGVMQRIIDGKPIIPPRPGSAPNILSSETLIFECLKPQYGGFSSNGG